MENQYFTPTNPLCVWVQRILPLVYDDSLSYYEVLAKVVEKINILINNNNNIPAYVKQVFNEFIESGQLEILVKQIIDRQDIVVNVKYPPENVVAAVGDGATNDTAAFNSCIAYGVKNGIPVYIPAGTYMLDAMTINGNVQIFGTPKTNLYLNVKPEAGALFTIDGGNVRLFNLTAYGQQAKQPSDTTFLYVNEQNATVEVRNVTVTQFKRGFELIGTKSFKADSCIFVNNGMNAITTSSNAYKVTIDNCHFEGLTERNATTYIISNSNGLRLLNAEFLAGASIGINYVDSRDVFIHYYKSNITTPVTGTGLNPIIIENNGKIRYALDDDIAAYVANLDLETTGNITLETHDMTLNAANITETITGDKVSQAANRTDAVSGTAALEADSYAVGCINDETHNVAGQFNVRAGSYKMFDVVRKTPAGTTNYADEAPFIDNAGNNKALLVKGETDINAAINNLVTDIGNLNQEIGNLDGITGVVDDLVASVQAIGGDVQILAAKADKNSTDIDNLQQEVAGITAGLTLNFTTYAISNQIDIAPPSGNNNFTMTTLLDSINIASDGFYLVSCFRGSGTRKEEITYELWKPTQNSPDYTFTLNNSGDLGGITSHPQNTVQGCAVLPLTAGTYKLNAYRYDKGDTAYRFNANLTVLSIAKIG